MAEIKVLRPSETRIGPIGIVAMGDGAAAVGRAMRQTGKQLRELAYKSAYDKERKEGEQAAQLAIISARNTTSGNIEFPPLPEDLSPVAEKYYEPIARKRFFEAVANEVDAKALELARKYPKDVDAFDEEFEAYANTTATNSGDLEPLVRQITNLAQKQYGKTIYDEGIKFKRREAASHANRGLSRDINDLQNIAAQKGAAGAAIGAKKAAEKRAEENAAEYYDIWGSTWLDERQSRIDYSYYRGSLTRISNDVVEAYERENIEQANNPERKAAVASDIYNNLVVAVREGNLEKVTNSKLKAVLIRNGLSEKFLEEIVESGQAKKIAADIGATSGQIQEQLNAERSQRIVASNLKTLEDGISLGKEDGNGILSSVYGIQNGTDFKEKISGLLSPPEGMIGSQLAQWRADARPLQQLLFNSDGPLPDPVTDYFDSIDTLQGEDLEMALAVYQQATRFVSGKQGGPVFTQKLARGLDQKTILQYETFINIRDTFGTDKVPEFVSKYRDLKFNSTQDVLNSRIKTTLDSKESAQVATRNFVANEVLDGDGSSEEIDFFSTYADDLLLMYENKKEVKKILKNASETLFKESKFLHEKVGRSNYAPEAAYADETTLGYFVEGVAKKLELLPNTDPTVFEPNGRRPELGKDVFLIPDRRSGTSLPVYFLVDEDRNILRTNGAPLIVGHHYVASKVTEYRVNQIAASKKASEKAEARQRQIRKNWESGGVLQQFLVAPSDVL